MMQHTSAAGVGAGYRPGELVTLGLKGSAKMISNPERGFRFEIDGGCDAGAGVSDKELAIMRALNITVAQTYCYLSPSPTIDQAAIERMHVAFARLRAAGIKALWRFAYDRSMPGENNYSAATILSHIEQLSAPFQVNSDALYVLQAGFIGSWGEWHSSQQDLRSNATATSAIVEAELFSLLPPDRKINVRVGVYKLAGVLRRGPTPTTAPIAPGCPHVPPAIRPVCQGAVGGITSAQCTRLGCCFNSSAYYRHASAQCTRLGCCFNSSAFPSCLAVR